MKTLAFTPTAAHARVGQRIVWTNDDLVPHNVVHVSGPRFRSSRPRMREGTTYSIVVRQTGTIHYFCSIHPWMKATVEVSE